MVAKLEFPRDLIIVPFGNKIIGGARKGKLRKTAKLIARLSGVKARARHSRLTLMKGEECQEDQLTTSKDL